MKAAKLVFLALLALARRPVCLHSQTAQTASNLASLPQRDGSHDFDFLIGDWKAHVRRLPDRLNNSNVWVEYDGISNHHKTSRQQFELRSSSTSPAPTRNSASRRRRCGCTIPRSRQWSIYLVDVDNGTLDTPPVVGGFTGKRGEFFHQENFKGRTILGALRLARHLSEVVADGAVVLAGWWQDLGSELDLRAVAIAVLDPDGWLPPLSISDLLPN